MMESTTKSKKVEDFQKRTHRYKLTSNTKLNILNSLKWFIKNSDITSGFVSTVSSDGYLIKYDKVEGNLNDFVEQSPMGGYEIEIALFNYDGKILTRDEKWNLDFIHSYMRDDGLNSKIIEFSGKF